MQFLKRLFCRHKRTQWYSYLSGNNRVIELRCCRCNSIARKRVNIDLILEAIGKAENIEVSEEDIDIELEKLATQYKQDSQD